MDTSRLPLRQLVLDVLKPHKPNIVDFGNALCNEETLSNVNITVYAVDEKTESVKVMLEGEDIDFSRIKDRIEHNGAVVHSIDKVVYGSSTIPETESKV